MTCQTTGNSRGLSRLRLVTTAISDKRIHLAGSGLMAAAGDSHHREGGTYARSFVFKWFATTRYNAGVTVVLVSTCH